MWLVINGSPFVVILTHITLIFNDKKERSEAMFTTKAAGFKIILL